MTTVALGITSKLFTPQLARRYHLKKPRLITRTNAAIDPDLLEQSLKLLTQNSPHLADISNAVNNALATVADADLAAEVVQKTTEIATSDVVTNAATTAASKSGPFSSIANGLEAILKFIDSGLEGLHVPYSYGFAIIILTVLVKVVTFPLSKKQVESSIAMQALQPQIKEIQDQYKNDPQQVQQKTAALYQQAGVNPLAGCLPTLATIPVFIGLYRALLNAADEGVLREGFFAIPSLAGPTTISARQAGMGLSWLYPFKDGAPPIGWHDAGAYLILPFLIVLSQSISQQVLQPNKPTDPSQSGAQTFLKFLPLLLGWFSLNVPSGLTLYWITNNVLTTGQQIYLKRGAPTQTMATTEKKTAPTPFTSSVSSPPTTRKSEPVIEATASEVKPSGQQTGARRRKGDKFRARKAREAAKSTRKGSTARKKKVFVPEEAKEEVVAEFEKELAITAPAPAPKDVDESSEKPEPQELNNLS